MRSSRTIGAETSPAARLNAPLEKLLEEWSGAQRVAARRGYRTDGNEVPEVDREEFAFDGRYPERGRGCGESVGLRTLLEGGRQGGVVVFDYAALVALQIVLHRGEYFRIFEVGRHHRGVGAVDNLAEAARQHLGVLARATGENRLYRLHTLEVALQVVGVAPAHGSAGGNIVGGEQPCELLEG